MLKESLLRHRFRFSSEKDLQDGIEMVLLSHGVPYLREAHLGISDRPDFMIGGIAMEVKTKGSLSALLRQIARYAEHEEVADIIVIGSIAWIPEVPEELNGKPVHSIYLIGSVL